MPSEVDLAGEILESLSLGAYHTLTKSIQAGPQIRNLTDEVFYISADNRTGQPPGPAFQRDAQCVGQGLTHPSVLTGAELPAAKNRS